MTTHQRASSYLQARAVQCPVCAAPPGDVCRYTGGGMLGLAMSLLHPSRYQEASS